MNNKAKKFGSGVENLSKISGQPAVNMKAEFEKYNINLGQISLDQQH
jgi:hypothetical protein